MAVGTGVLVGCGVFVGRMVAVGAGMGVAAGREETFGWELKACGVANDWQAVEKDSTPLMKSTFHRCREDVDL